MDLGGFGWGLQTIIGGLLLAGVIAWAALRNRATTTRRDVEQSEGATRELYREEETRRREESDGAPDGTPTGPTPAEISASRQEPADSG